ncbi:hypothetical protein [Egicoccus sp. AB-alg6-2]|uniref:hypothetical protein n=1 Tax=Egicoccus sp. AB-alg6-2 TaxID=3242692 RepID=UPI00359E9FD1
MHPRLLSDLAALEIAAAHADAAQRRQRRRLRRAASARRRATAAPRRVRRGQGVGPAPHAPADRRPARQ